MDEICSEDRIKLTDILIPFHVNSHSEFRDWFTIPPDLILIVNDERISVHRELLCLKSDYFNAMLNSSWTIECHQNEVHLQETSYKLFIVVLESFYTNIVRIPIEFDILNIYELYHLYKRYLFFAPANSLIENISSIFNEYGWDSLWHMLDIVATTDEDDLFKCCMDWIQKNQINWPKNRTAFSFKHFRSMSLKSIKAFLDYNCDINEDFFLIACMKWIKHNKLNENQALTLLRKIRVSFLSWQYLSQYDSIIAPQLSHHLHSIWKSQMRLLLNVDSKLSKINQSWKCDITKDVCYIPNPKYIKMRAFCLYDENVVYSPMLVQRIESLKDDSSCLPCIIDLRFPFWLNEICLKFSSNSSDKFQYVLEYSVDGRDWKILFDYRKYFCSSNQFLIFKSTVIRFLRLSGLVQHQLKSQTSRPIDCVVNLEAYYRSSHNFYSYGLREGLYYSPYHIYLIKSSIFPQQLSYTNDADYQQSTMIILTEQPVLVNKYHLHIPEGFKICYTFEIFNADTNEFELVCDRSNEFCQDIQVIFFTDRPVNLIRIIIKKLISSELVKNQKFRFKSLQFFTLKELQSISLSEFSREFP